MAYRILGFAAAFIFAQAVFAFGQDPDLGNQNSGTRRPAQRPAPPARPTPHYADGRINLGPPPGEAGIWLPGPGGTPGEPFPPRTMQVPYQPWAQELLAYRRQNQFEPHTRCKPSGGPRQFLTPYGVEFVDRPELQRLYIMDLGGPHSFRTIYMDAKSHPKNLVTSY